MRNGLGAARGCQALGCLAPQHENGTPPLSLLPQCSAPCGGGVQRRLVRCVNTHTGLPEEDSEQCSHEAWPENSRPCGTQDCELTEPPRKCPHPAEHRGDGESPNCCPTALLTKRHHTEAGAVHDWTRAVQSRGSL